ncbi:hypothetical protein [Sulfitobacter mediterraneus]|uniref:hypothetical protein n=1 Tax=Sulfitobacter mediterraneus TaxID=83219 RepID=UPI00248F79D4|nr:hypothetical protein [Sulfitobacter mediterraneus]
MAASSQKQPLTIMVAKVANAGHSRLWMTQLSLAQKMLASAASLFWQRSTFHQTSHSPVLISPDFKLHFRCSSAWRQRADFVEKLFLDRSRGC